MKRAIALTAVALSTVAGLALAPSASASACATIDGSVNGTALPVNGTYCAPELPPAAR